MNNSEASPPISSPEQKAYQSTTYRYFVLALLTLVYVLSFVDRQVISILSVHIIDDLKLSDTQFGALSGIAFAAIYVTLGIPVARWADLGIRRNIIAGSLALWSVMTAACGMTQNFWQLFAARAGVGIGEAGCTPPAHSMISDIFPARKRTTAISIYTMGTYGGILIAYVAGARLAEAFDWRTAFIVVGMPGVVLALLLRWWIKEPPRGFAEGASAEISPPFSEVFRVMWNKPSFRHIAIGASLHSFVGYGLSGFLPIFFSRVHDLPTTVIGDYLGVVTGVAGVLGILLGGLITDKLANKHDDVRWQVWVPMVTTVAAAPFLFLMLLYFDRGVPAIWFYFIPGVINSMYLGPTFSITHSLVNLRTRAMASAVMLFFINLIGLGLGPLLTGVLSDSLAQFFQQEAIRYALALMVLVLFWSGWHYWLSAKYLRADLYQA